MKGRYVREVGGKVRHTSSIVRKALFDSLNVEDKTFLELFCGSCVVSIEALSRGAKEVHVVDVSGRSITVCKSNLKELGLIEKAKIYKTDAVRFVKSSGISYDVVFMDPPYEFGLVSKVLKNMREDLVAEDGTVVVEHSKREHFEVPDFLKILDIKHYGDTVLTFMKRITL